MIARRDTRETILVGSCLLDDVDGIPDDRVYLGIVLLHVTLSEFEQGALRLLHQFINIDRLVERLGLDDAGKGDELSGQRLLCDDARMVFDIGRRSHTGRQFGDISRSSDILEVTLLGQLFRHGPYVYRRLVHGEFADGSVHFLVAGFIETLRCEHLTHHGIGVLVNHQGTQYGTFNLSGLRLYVGIGIVDRLLSAATLTIVVGLFWHCLFSFWAYKGNTIFPKRQC